MGEININYNVIKEIYLFISEYFTDPAVADYVFDIFSIERSEKIRPEVSYEKFFKLLNYIQRMTGDQEICLNAGKHYARNRIHKDITVPGLRFSTRRTFHQLDKILKRIFPELNISLNSKSKNSVSISILSSESAVNRSYFFAEYLKGVISYIPIYWELPQAKIKIVSYPFSIEDLLDDIDINYHKKESSLYIYDKKIADERPDKNNESLESKPIQRAVDNLYIKYIYLENNTLLNTDELKFDIKWHNLNKGHIIKYSVLSLIGAGAAVYSFMNDLLSNERLISMLFMYEVFILLLYNIRKSKELKQLFKKIEFDLTRELFQQKSITGLAIDRTTSRLQSIENLMIITKRIIHDENIVNLFDNIRKLTAKALDADRTTVFIHDKEARELTSGPELSEEKQEFRIPEDKGIAGEIFKLKKIVNIKDAYNNPNFNKSVDRKTGYRTRTILGAPLLDLDGNLQGVIQVLNKNNGEFQQIDEQIIESLSTYIAIALKNILTIQKLQLQGIDPEIARGLSSIITFIYYGYQTIENEISLLDTPAANSLKPLIKDLSDILEKLIFLFDESYAVNDKKIHTQELFALFARYINENKREKGISFRYLTCIDEDEIVLDTDLFDKAVSAILKNSIEAISSEGEIIIRVYYFADLPNTVVHEYSLKEIIDNFNKFSEDNRGGFISFLQNRKPILQSDLERIRESIKESIAIEIFDSGEGIESEIKKKIFHPFFSSKNHFGLGLAIAKTALARMGGKIEEPREDEKGKTIRILIPLKRELPSIEEKPGNQDI